jgi:hypothetical protein
MVGLRSYFCKKSNIYILDVYVFFIILRLAQALKISSVVSSVHGVFFLDLVAVHLAKNQMGHGTPWSARASYMPSYS